MSKCQSALLARGEQVRLRSVFVESDPERADLLEARAKIVGSNITPPEVWRCSFEAAMPDIVRWLEKDEFAFVFVDPFGWKDIVTPSILAPLLRRAHTELLINFMWNFVNLATGHATQKSNLETLFGPDWEEAANPGGEVKRRELMKLYRAKLSDTCDGQDIHRLRTGMLPVEYAGKKQVIFYLVYATHLVVFHEEAEKVAAKQSQFKLQHRLNNVAKTRGQNDLFSADDHRDEPRLPAHDLKDIWLKYIPSPGDEVVVNAIVMADLVEGTDYLFSEIKAAVKELIEEGIVQNLDAKRPRPTNPVDYRKTERLRRIK